MRSFFGRVALAVLAVLTPLLAMGPTASAAPADWSHSFRIVNTASSQVLIPNGFGQDKSEGAVIWAHADGPTGGRYWQADRLPNGTTLLRNTDTHMCLKAGTTGYGPTVVQSTCTHTDDRQQWYVRDYGRGGAHLVNAGTGDAITPYNPNANSWAMLKTPSRERAQLWDFVG